MASRVWWRAVEAREVAALEAMTDALSQRLGDNLNALLHCPLDDLEAPAITELGAELGEELRAGKGFAVLRGLPLDRWSRRDALLAYWLLGNRLGTPLPNNARGDMVGHVVDLGHDYRLSTARGYDSNAKLSYHSDQCDVVGLLCLQKARRGGLSKLVSAMAVYDRIAATRPDLLAVLSQPFYFSRLGEIGAGQLAWYEAPVFDCTSGFLHCAGGINHIRKGHEIPGAPPLSDQQLEALKHFEATCQALEFSMAFEPGDIQLLNNGLILHTRTAFEDWPGPERRRHLLRLWLRLPDMHVGAAYFENWRQGVTPSEGAPRIRLSP